MRLVWYAWLGFWTIMVVYVIAMVVRPELRAADRWPTRTRPVQRLIQFLRWLQS